MNNTTFTSISIAAVCAGLLLAASPAAGLTYVMVPDTTLADRAEVIAEVRVLGIDPSPANAEGVVTDYSMVVEHVIQGEVLASPVTVRVVGGIRPDGTGLYVDGAPGFVEGQRALLFLRSRPDGTFRVLHYMLGAFHLVEHGGTTLALRQLADANALALSDRVAPRTGPRDLELFRAWLADRARGVERAGDYFADALVASDAFEKFTILTSGGRKIRWPGFSSNVSIRAHQDGQPGLDSGGFTETSQAASAWRNDPDSDIRYNYVGTTSATGGLTDFDSVNALLFDDPNGNDSFDEPFNCSDGGVIAVGGPWFGGTHSYRGEVYHTAVGADVVTNKGIDCISGSQPWIAGNRRAAEVFTHELGHTLGLGHSCGDDDSPSCGSSSTLNDATMRATVHGDNRGAQIRTDDRLGIRFLYGDPLTPPAAPSGLTATTISDARIDLAWSDNSDNEEMFDLERSTGGSFSRIALPPANSTSYQDTTVVAGMTYTYRVRAFNDAGTSAFSNQATASTPGDAAPSDLRAYGVSDSQIRLFWTDESAMETGFEIEGRTGADPFALLMTVPANTETADVGGLAAVTTYTFRVRSVSGTGASVYSNEAATTTFFSDPDPCVAGPDTLCLNDGRFEVQVTWTDYADLTGPGIDIGFPATDSGLFYFFHPANWEMQVKVLDACSAESPNFWVFAAATTDVAYDLMVTDTVSGFSRTYSNALGVASPAIIDTSAFATCFADVPPAAPSSVVDPGVDDPLPSVPDVAPKGGCLPSATRFCLRGGRFAVEVEWMDFFGGTGFGRTDPFASADSGLMWFFDPDNLEVLVKVLDGCAFNNRIWVFAAATTNVEYTLRVTDTVTDVTREYFNELGNAADAITDSAAFDSCP